MNPESIYYLFEAGRKRKQEDYIWPIPGKATVNDRVFIVCDGAGSFNGGEIASKLICEFMAAKVLRFSEQKMSEDLINRLLTEARDRLISYAREYRLDTDLATTFSMIILYDQKALLTWCGDSRIYHVREGEIIFRTENDSLVKELIHEDEMAGGNGHVQAHHNPALHSITADSSPIYAQTKWIEDVRDGDYFLLYTKGLLENVKDDDIKFLLSQNDKANFDPAKSIKQLSFEKTRDNYSMYLLKVNSSGQKKAMRYGVMAGQNQKRGIGPPIFILAMTIIGAVIIFFYSQKRRSVDATPKHRNQATQQAVVPRLDSVTKPVRTSESKSQVSEASNSFDNSEVAPATLQNDSSVHIQTIDKPIDRPVQTNQAPRVEAGQPSKDAARQAPKEEVKQATEDETSKPPKIIKKTSGQLLIKFTTEESCKLKITNLNTDEVIDWDLSSNDNARIYLKEGKYSIVATSEMDSSKSKTYHFDVSSENANTTQSVRIKF